VLIARANRVDTSSPEGTAAVVTTRKGHRRAEDLHDSPTPLSNHERAIPAINVRRWLWILVGILVVALIVAYFMYMSLGMPGIDSQLAPIRAPIRRTLA
jgi:hypothetical protein